MITAEKWKCLECSEGYSISNKGRVRNDKSGYILKTPIGTYGYPHISLFKKSYFVHRLVAEYFLDKVEGCDFINHKDEDKSNPAVDNLEWCTHQYNTEYSVAKSYKFLNPEGVLVEIFNLKKFCRENNLTAPLMCYVHNGKREHHKQWRKYYGSSL